MKLKDLPQKLQDFAILRMVEDEDDIKIHEDIEVSQMFSFKATTELDEWFELAFRNNLKPMYNKYPKLRP